MMSVKGSTKMCLGATSIFFSQYFLRKRWIFSRENKERKDKVGNIFLPPAIKTLLSSIFFREKDG
jgi:hypothetical protein